MNFAITGKKIVSTQQEKKPILPLDNKKKTQALVNKSTSRKPSLPATNTKLQQKIVKKQQPKKVPPKIQKKTEQPNPQQPKQAKLQQPPKLQVKQQVKPQQIPQKQIKLSEIMVRYNHYKDKFPTQNNILKYQVIEDKYSFASVFKGNFIPKLQIFRNYGKYIEPLTEGNFLDYAWEVQEGKQYEITIQEDQEEQSKYEKKAYIAPKKEDTCLCKKNKRVTELTQEMRNMAVEELGSQKHKELLQQRALEQILYS